jgi:PAS domain S-box-containing protein
VHHFRTDLTGLSVTAADFLAAVLDSAAQPIWAVDTKGLIRFANPAAGRALGYDDAQELLGRNSHETIHYARPDGTPYPARECPMLLPRETGETVSSDHDWFFRRDGSTFPVSYVSVPVELREGRGAVVAFTDIEERLAAERILREHDAVLATREASMRRIATLVAGGATSPEVFAAIAREVGQVLGAALVVIWRYEPDRPATVFGAWSDRPHPFQVGSRWPVEPHTAAALLPRLDRPTRVEDFGAIGGAIADAIHGTGVRSGAGTAIVVDGELWGTMGVAVAEGEPLGVQIENDLAEFTELLATAISTTASRAALSRLADEQAALRRVATLAARGVPSSELFAAVGEEIGRLLGADLAAVFRYESDGRITSAAGWAAAAEPAIEVGRRWRLDEMGLSAPVVSTRREEFGRRARFGTHSSVASPIVVAGQPWGALVVYSTHPEPMPADTETRLENFADLVATAISTAHARADVQRLADQQAALRRVATLVAQDSPPAQVFAVVTEEAGRLLQIEDVKLVRYEPDATATVVASWGQHDPPTAVGTNWSLRGESVTATVYRTWRSARIDDYADASGPLAEFLRIAGIHSAVATPIMVGRQLWGTMIVSTRRPEALPAGTEADLAEFTALVGAAISNIQARSDLAASRARIVAATDAERRRVVRDLHDGAQQTLVLAVMTLKQMSRALEHPLLAEALDQTERATNELRELAHGILPEALTHGGLHASVQVFASRLPMPVENGVCTDRFPAPVEATAYFVVAEALTNVVKHAGAGRATVTARVEDGALRIQVRDDGVGGARQEGSGLLGLGDRLSALGGRLWVESPRDGGTVIVAEIPVAAEDPG